MKLIEINGKDFYYAFLAGEGIHYSGKCETLEIHGMKLYYWFDFGDDWTFEIKKSRKKIEKKDNVKYPRIVKKIGEILHSIRLMNKEYMVHKPVFIGVFV
jgi:hypothetical protein